MEWLSQYWLELLFFVVDVVTALILFFKTRDIKYLRNLKKDSTPPVSVSTDVVSQSSSVSKPEVYLSVSKLKDILSDLEKEDNNGNIDG